jgi:hypothetical protein
MAKENKTVTKWLAMPVEVKLHMGEDIFGCPYSSPEDRKEGEDIRVLPERYLDFNQFSYGSPRKGELYLSLAEQGWVRAETNFMTGVRFLILTEKRRDIKCRKSQ